MFSILKQLFYCLDVLNVFIVELFLGCSTQPFGRAGQVGQVSSDILSDKRAPVRCCKCYPLALELCQTGRTKHFSKLCCAHVNECKARFLNTYGKLLVKVHNVYTIGKQQSSMPCQLHQSVAVHCTQGYGVWSFKDSAVSTACKTRLLLGGSESRQRQSRSECTCRRCWALWLPGRTPDSAQTLVR
jgi:hypothetical protein